MQCHDGVERKSCTANEKVTHATFEPEESCTRPTTNVEEVHLNETQLVLTCHNTIINTRTTLSLCGDCTVVNIHKYNLKRV